MSDEDRAEKVRSRMHELWEQAGSPDGKEEEFREQAEAQVDAEDGKDPE